MSLAYPHLVPLFCLGDSSNSIQYRVMDLTVLVSISELCLVRLMEKIPCREGHTLVELTQISAQEDISTREWDAHHLVWVEGDGVGSRDACDFVLVFIAEDDRSSPRNIDMHP